MELTKREMFALNILKGLLANNSTHHTKSYHINMSVIMADELIQKLEITPEGEGKNELIVINSEGQ